LRADWLREQFDYLVAIHHNDFFTLPLQIFDSEQLLYQFFQILLALNFSFFSISSDHSGLSIF